MRRGSWCTSFYGMTAGADNPAANKKMPSHLNGGSAIWGALTARTRGSAAPALGRECFDVGEGYVAVPRVSTKNGGGYLSWFEGRENEGARNGPLALSLRYFGCRLSARYRRQ